MALVAVGLELQVTEQMLQEPAAVTAVLAVEVVVLLEVEVMAQAAMESFTFSIRSRQ
jgi:hypothetical protein